MSGDNVSDIPVDGDFDLVADCANAQTREVASRTASSFPTSRKRARARSATRSKSPSTGILRGPGVLMRDDHKSVIIRPTPTISREDRSLEADIEALHKLSSQANELATRQHRHEDASIRLRTRLAQSEQTYGELLRQSLQLQQSIEERRKQIKVEQQELATEQAAAKLAGEQLRRVLAEQHSLFKVKVSNQTGSEAMSHVAPREH